MRSYIDRLESGTKEVDCEILHRSVGEWNETFFTKVWKPLPSSRLERGTKHSL